MTNPSLLHQHVNPAEKERHCRVQIGFIDRGAIEENHGVFESKDPGDWKGPEHCPRPRSRIVVSEQPTRRGLDGLQD